MKAHQLDRRDLRVEVVTIVVRCVILVVLLVVVGRAYRLGVSTNLCARWFGLRRFTDVQLLERSDTFVATLVYGSANRPHLLHQNNFLRPRHLGVEIILSILLYCSCVYVFNCVASSRAFTEGRC